MWFKVLFPFRHPVWPDQSTVSICCSHNNTPWYRPFHAPANWSSVGDVPATCGVRPYLYKALELSLSAILTITRPIMTAHFPYINGLKPVANAQSMVSACLAPKVLSLLFRETTSCRLLDNVFEGICYHHLQDIRMSLHFLTEDKCKVFK